MRTARLWGTAPAVVAPMPGQGTRTSLPTKWHLLLIAMMSLAHAGVASAESDDEQSEDQSKEEPSKEEPSKEEPSKKEPSKEEPSKEEPSKEEPSKEDQSDPLTGNFKLTPRVLLVVNAAFGDRLLIPGSYGLFAVRPIFGGAQFELSPSNSSMGFTADGVSTRHFDFSAALDITLKSPTPLIGSKVLAPQFYSAFMQAESERLKIRIGQYPDVILPFVIPTTNGFPGSYMPGQIGFTRPQLRADARLPIADSLHLILQGSLSRPIQTFELADELVAGATGVPDGQARIALAAGPTMAARDPWQRSYELGVSGHVGRRRVVTIADEGITDSRLSTWSANADFRANLPTGTTVLLRIWRGSLLGDYAAGIFQTVSPALLTPVGAQGYFFALKQGLTRRWSANAGFGRDNPRNADIGSGERTLNQAGFANIFWNWSSKMGFAVEGSRWRTSFEDQGSTRIWRGEVVSIFRL